MSSQMLSIVDEILSIVPESGRETFAFLPGVTPFSSVRFVLTATLLYLLTVGILQSYIKWRGKPFGLSTFSTIYDWCLSAMSAVLFIALVRQIKYRIESYGFWSFFCDERMEHTAGEHIYLYYIIYLTKYLEYCDTFLLCLRGKHIPFIHLYHHAVTSCFAYIHLHEQTCIYWTMAAMNLFVHIILYAYFALLESNRHIWWKKGLTFLQVFQFYLTFIPSLAALLPRVLYAVDPELPFAHACHGSWRGAGVGFVLLFVYLVLFQRLYSQRYRKQTKANGNASRQQSLKPQQTLLPTPTSGLDLGSSTMWGDNANYTFRQRRLAKLESQG